ncbi:hypothetical protein RRG08_006189 [Elysia crispata]|uniref:Uncharacterized protein n=1 Tax=Elysia crispata TaxID=231223 RepID=A0AAE1DSR1_9GAST|nr:hypothetical protein RRG08_006189 [Elysia crispata]
MYGMRELLVEGLTRLAPAFSNTSVHIHREERKCFRSTQTPAVVKSATNTSWDFFGMHYKISPRMKYVKAFVYLETARMKLMVFIQERSKPHQILISSQHHNGLPVSLVCILGCAR